LFEGITEEENMYGYFMEDLAAANTANNSINVLNKVPDDRWISFRL
jgi:hypothetical protein